MIFGNAAYHHDGTQYWSIGGVPGDPQVGNLDSDPDPEILVTRQDGILVLEHDGVVKFGPVQPFDPGVNPLCWNKPAAIHDFDGDGHADLAISSCNTYGIFTVGASGLNKLWSSPVNDSSGIASSTGFDFLGRGIADAVYGDQVALYVYDGKTGASELQQARASRTIIEYPIVADIDNDGSADILVVSNAGSYPALQVFQDAQKRWIPTRRDLEPARVHVTNVREDGTIPQDGARAGSSSTRSARTRRSKAAPTALRRRRIRNRDVHHFERRGRKRSMENVGLGELRPALAGALEKKGFTELTPVQEAVLDPALAGRDLRITSQTGSGKTVAIGFALARARRGADARRVEGRRRRSRARSSSRRRASSPSRSRKSSPGSSRRSARRVASVTGGASFRDERRALAAGPAVDRRHAGAPARSPRARRASTRAQLGAVVLDEADRMLDLGFRDDLEAILAHAPEEHRTHLVSATFPREVRALADRVQNDPAHVEGTPLGAANTDIEHVIHLVDPRERSTRS